MWPEGSHDILKTTKRPQTAGTIFKNSMNELMNILASKEPHYVRCIKPNEMKSATKMDKERVIHQISYLGKYDTYFMNISHNVRNGCFSLHFKTEQRFRGLRKQFDFVLSHIFVESDFVDKTFEFSRQI